MFRRIFWGCWGSFFGWVGERVVGGEWGIGWKMWKMVLAIMKILNAKMKIMLVQGVFLFLIYFRVFHKPIFHIFHTLPQKGFSLGSEAKQSGSFFCNNAFSASTFSA